MHIPALGDSPGPVLRYDVYAGDSLRDIANLKQSLGIRDACPAALVCHGCTDASPRDGRRAPADGATDNEPLSVAKIDLLRLSRDD